MAAEKINGQQLNELIQGGETVVVDFYADWCGPCQMFIPVFKQHAENEEIKMVMVNIDDDAEAAGAAGVQGVPTIQIYKDGAKVEENVGFMTPDQLVEFINRVK